MARQPKKKQPQTTAQRLDSIIKSARKITKAQDADGWKAAHKRALATIMDEKNVTSPRKGGQPTFTPSRVSSTLSAGRA